VKRSSKDIFKGAPRARTVILTAVIAVLLGAGGAVGTWAQATAKAVAADFGELEPTDGLYVITPGQLITVGWSSQPAGLFMDKVTLESGEPAVIRVLGDGNQFTVEGVAPGEATITLSSARRRAVQEYSFVVSVLPSGLTGLPADLVLNVDETSQLEPVIEPAESAYPVVFASDNDSVVTVDRWGEVKATGAGDATITAACGPIAEQIAVTVRPRVESVVLPEASAALVPGQTYQLKPVIEPADAGDQSLTYSSSNPAGATVDGNGLVTARWDARLSNDATITVKSADGPSAEFSVQWSNPYVPGPGKQSTKIPGTPFLVTPMVFGSPVPDCVGLTVGYSLVEASSDAVFDELMKGSFDLWVASGSANWAKVGTFKMDGSESTTIPAAFSARRVSQFAVVPSNSPAEQGANWNSTFTISDVLFAGQELAADT
jgi:hypothetical protein